MPFVVACDPPQDQNSPSHGKGKAKAPSRPPLANITPTAVKRTPLGVKSVAPLATKAQTSEVPTEDESPRFPSATIEVNSIGAEMAARLVACLLGHVLFLKGQIPLPVAQLKRMSSQGRSSQPPNKKTDKLLSSFVVLSTQLVNSFAALASALSSSHNSITNRANRSLQLAKTHVAVILGPSPTSMIAARARVVLEIDGFCVAFPKTTVLPSGMRLAPIPNEGLKENARHNVPVGKKDRSPTMPLADHGGSQDISSSTLSPGVSDGEMEDESNIIQTPPDSDAESDYGPSGEDSDEELDSNDEISDLPETESGIARAERTLSRTLVEANANAELGMASETRPTQIHILIRAPRCFSHPAWIPRENLGRDMDPVLREFEDLTVNKGALNDIINSDVGHDRPLPKAMQAGERRRDPRGKTEYVRVRSRGAEESLDLAGEERIDDSHTGYPGASRESLDEGADSKEGFEDKGDELIWWSWDGRLEGFTDI